MEKIDFVLPWVDDTDPQWLKRKNDTWRNLHLSEEIPGSDEKNGDCRYREMGTLKYWFRAVEKFAPWVNKVFFITCGQRPAWLNIDHPKLVLVHHEDYIPAQYLPTFNVNPIELNLHRIPGLSEHFVYLNDDTFLIRPVSPDFFFRAGKPCLPADLSICDYFGYNNWSFLCLNDYCVLNDHFNFYDSIWNNRDKWFNIKELGAKVVFKNLLCHRLNRTMVIRGYEHLPTPQLKSTFGIVWDNCPKILDSTSRQAFRSNDQVNQWLICGWNQASGNFWPTRPYSHGFHFNICEAQLEAICSLIRNQAAPQLCLNDSEKNDAPQKCFSAIIDALDSILPEKSGFEL